MKENIKKSIEEKMNNGDLENVFEMLDAYEKTCPQIVIYGFINVWVI